MNADNSWFPELRMIVDDTVYELHLTYEPDAGPGECWEAQAEHRLNENVTVSYFEWIGRGNTIEEAIMALAELVEEYPPEYKEDGEDDDDSS
jgi:hypothetical protein